MQAVERGIIMRCLNKIKYIPFFFGVVFSFVFVGFINVYAEEHEYGMTTEERDILYADYLAYLNLPNITEDDMECEYLGAYDGCEVVIMHICDEETPAMNYELQLGRYVFNFGMGADAKKFYLHRDNTFVPIKDAYEAGFLMDNALMQIAEKIKSQKIAEVTVLETDLLLSKTREKNLLADYLMKFGKPELTTDNIQYECYGIFDESEVVVIKNANKESTGKSTDIQIGSFVFTFADNEMAENFYLHKESAFIPVLKSYEEGILNEEDIAWIAKKMNHSKYEISVYKIDDIDNLTLSTANEEQLISDYVKLINQSYVNKDTVHYEWYGTYNDCKVVWMQVDDMDDTADIREISIGNYLFTFYMGSSSGRFYAYKNGGFMLVKDAYETGILSDEDMDQISHNFEKTKWAASVRRIVQNADIVLPFNDVLETDWFYLHVNKTFNTGLMTGMEEHIWGPYEILPRAQFVTILSRMEEVQGISYTDVFDDVAEGEWYTDAVLWAVDKEIVTGYKNGYFGPADYITREQMAVMLYRYAEYKRYNITENTDLTNYPDASDISPFAEKAVAWCVAKGIILGNDGKLLPQENTSRAECAAMISRFVGLYE